MSGKEPLAPSELAFFSALGSSLTPEEERFIKEGGLDRAPWSTEASSVESSGSSVHPQDRPPKAVEVEDKLAADERFEPRSLFLRNDISPAIYGDYLTSKYKAQWVQWEEPETVWRTIERDHDLPDGAMVQVARDKVSAFRAIYHVDTVFEDSDAFENAVLAWNDILSNFGVVEGARPEQMAYFMLMVKRLFRGGREPGYDVRKYVAGMLGTEGWVVVPRGLETFQPDLDDYNLQSMSNAELMTLKQSILEKLKVNLTDDDENPAEVGAARVKKVALYLRMRAAQERRHRELFKVPELRAA